LNDESQNVNLILFRSRSKTEKKENRRLLP